MFSLVGFVESHEVELLPAICVENGQCYCPNSLRVVTLHQAIKNKMAPNYRYEEGRRKVKEAETWSDLQSDAEMSGQKPPRWKMYGYLFSTSLNRKSVGIGPPGGCLLDSEEESAQLLPPAPTVNLPAVIPNNTLPPVPTSILPTAAPPAPQGTYTEMLQSCHDFFLNSLKTVFFYSTAGLSDVAPQQSSEPGWSNSDFHSVILLHVYWLLHCKKSNLQIVNSV
ncbi:Anoctamin-8 [Labeo rohita]|uniref:Anoctamin-8 n=1 Tax=Labeo rohita TaxID=84645 RepID=A0ABQ8MSB3_LABRO|nr:Anoctamin-8 [Labeo rohita]